jgi:hypothetical protein
VRERDRQTDTCKIQLMLRIPEWTSYISQELFLLISVRGSVDPTGHIAAGRIASTEKIQ